MVNSDIKEKLQHPRRSLGNRHRSQAEKFLKISNDESNLNWADQSAKQAILYDFTNPENWKRKPQYNTLHIRQLLNKTREIQIGNDTNKF